VAPPSRTETYPADKRTGYLAGTDLITALRIHGTPIELPVLSGQNVATLGRSGDLRVDHPYLAAVHVRLERVSGNWLRVENISTDRKNPLIVDHHEVSQCYIKPGDQFRIGDTTYFALNEEMRLARRSVTEILGETRDTQIDDCLIAAAADADRHVVLIGEPGSDQQRLAGAIHWASTRRHNRFVEVAATRKPGTADLQSIRDARDGTLLLWLPVRGKFDQTFISSVLAPHAKVRLIICTTSLGKVDGSIPGAAADGAARFTIAPLRERKEDIPVLMDRWFIQDRSKLRFRTLAPVIQDKLISHRWRRNLQELQTAAHHLILLTHYRSEREADRDASITRSESRTWRKRLKLPLPLLPGAPDSIPASPATTTSRTTRKKAK
jgi:hypothetical protein